MTVHYTKDHEYVRVEGDTATIGITDYAQQQLGDVVFVELPNVGREVKQGAEAAVVESVKAASEIYAPVGGEVIEGNTAVVEEPALVNQGAESQGWFFKLRLRDPGETAKLMDPDAYAAYLESIA
jgi:glycine cleavage system H protein